MQPVPKISPEYQRKGGLRKGGVRRNHNNVMQESRVLVVMEPQRRGSASSAGQGWGAGSMKTSQST